MSKLTFQAPAYFIKLNKENAKIKKEINLFLSEKTGYSQFWCKENFREAFNILNINDKKIISTKASKAEVLKNYAWSRFIYTNWNEVGELYGNLLFTFKYNNKNKTITIKKSSKLLNIFKQIAKDVKQKILNKK